MKKNENPDQKGDKLGTAENELKKFIHQLESADLTKEKIQLAASYFERIGLFSLKALYSFSRRGELDKLLKKSNLDKKTIDHIVARAEKSFDADTLKRLDKVAAKKFPTGHIDWTKPEIKKYYERLGIKEPRALDKSQFAAFPLRMLMSYLVPNGPKKAIDLRPFLGDARNQGGRGTCGVHCGAVVSEALEYLRDRRRGPVNLSEEFIWWYRGAGQRYSAGGYGGEAAIEDVRDVGVCEEYVLPYNPVQNNDNHSQVPITDIAIDRAQFYRAGDPINLPDKDVNAVKRVLESGRCVGIGCDLDGWDTSTGQIVMPPEGTQPGGSHCVTIVGYIDRPDLPDELGGGYFIVRNSWGGNNSPDHILGPEYGGHLLMPYQWYHLYAGWPVTVVDQKDNAALGKWLVEYYSNQDLMGAPLETGEVDVLFFSTTVNLPQEVNDVNFDWNDNSPVTISLPLLGTKNALPTDHFSVRFTKVIRFREGWVRFHLRGDDGLRLYVDDRLVINQWKDQPTTEYSAEHYLTGGDHIIRIEYYEAAGRADVRFTMEPINWTYQVFNNLTFSRAPGFTFTDTLTQPEWRHRPPLNPARGVTNGQFSLRATARMRFKAGQYRFHNFSSGHMKYFLDGNLVADLINDGDQLEVTVTAGVHEVRVDFINNSIVPADGSHSYYKAFCKFSWSDVKWNARFYTNTKYEQYTSDSDPIKDQPDRNYIFFRTSSLTGNVRYEHDYPEVGPGDNTLTFDSWDTFKQGITNWPADFNLKFWGVWINRKIVIPESGTYNLTLKAGEGNRLIVDGKEITQNQEFIGSSPYNADLYLERGAHDVSIEYNGTQWGGDLQLTIESADWEVLFYHNQTLSAPSTPRQSLRMEEIPNAARALFPANSGFSLKATREFWLPMGKYIFYVEGDDGVRLKINNHLVIDGWQDQSATGYNTVYEHPGGKINVTLEYYQAYGDAVLNFAVHPAAFYGEYYATKTLNKMPEGVSRPRITPAAYRYETNVDFDWGNGSLLSRIGSKNFSVRWTGKINLPVGRWRFEAASDDGIRVYVDGRLLIDHWHPQSLTTHSRMLDLTGREHEIKVEYFQQEGSGACRVKYVRIA